MQEWPAAPGDYTEAWFLPFHQQPLGRSNDDLHVMLRVRSPAAVGAARAAITEVDPDLPTYEVAGVAALLPAHRATRIDPAGAGAVLSSMLYSLLADAVLVFHFAFILFVGGGGLLALWWRHGPWLHLPVAAWGVWIELSGNVCPLTPLENDLRRMAGEEGYAGSFIEHYLLPIIYPSGLTREVQLMLAALVIVLNLAIYGLVWARSRTRRQSRDG